MILGLLFTGPYAYVAPLLIAVAVLMVVAQVATLWPSRRVSRHPDGRRYGR